MIQFIKDKIEDLLYNSAQMGLVFVLFLIILLVLPISVYGMIFFTPISADEVNYYSKFGAWFTALGAIFTVINTVVVIYLMIWLHRKETSISLLPQLSELRKNLIEIHQILSTEIEYFNDEQFNNYEALYENSYQGGFDFYGHKNLHKQEIENLSGIIERADFLYKIFLSFKEQINNLSNMDFHTYQTKSKILNLINEILVLHKPSSEYKKSFVTGSKLDAEPEDMIEAAKKNSLKYINEIIELLEEKAH